MDIIRINLVHNPTLTSKTFFTIYDWKFGYPNKTPEMLNKIPQMEKYRRNFGYPTKIIKP